MRQVQSMVVETEWAKRWNPVGCFRVAPNKKAVCVCACVCDSAVSFSRWLFSCNLVGNVSCVTLHQEEGASCCVVE